MSRCLSYLKGLWSPKKNRAEHFCNKCGFVGVLPQGSRGIHPGCRYFAAELKALVTKFDPKTSRTFVHYPDWHVPPPVTLCRDVPAGTEISSSLLQALVTMSAAAGGAIDYEKVAARVRAESAVADRKFRKEVFVSQLRTATGWHEHDANLEVLNRALEAQGRFQRGAGKRAKRGGGTWQK